MTGILQEELAAFKKDVQPIIAQMSGGTNLDKLNLVFSRFQQYEEAKIAYITGTILAIEKRHAVCDYAHVKGETFFDKCDYYILQRTKIAKWFVGFMFTALISVLVYLFLSVSSGTERNYQLLLRIDKTLSVAIRQIEINTTRLDKVENKLYGVSR